MPRVKHAVSSRKHRKKTLKSAKGHVGSRSRLYRIAKESARRANIFSYVGRKHKKRDFRSLWIIRIGNACREEGLSYSKFMNALKKAGVTMNRKMLAELAVSDKAAFTALVKKVKV